MDYTAIENIEFIKGKLASREYYHLESESNVTATAGVKQKVEGTKDFLDGILVTETISYGAKAFGFIETPSKATSAISAKMRSMCALPLLTIRMNGTSIWNGRARLRKF